MVIFNTDYKMSDLHHIMKGNSQESWGAGGQKFESSHLDLQIKDL